MKDNFRKIKIPLPDISIQSRIGDKLRKARILKDQAIKLQEDAEKIIAWTWGLENGSSLLPL